ncbi:MAG: hypothetical protein ACREN6_07930 [Gemmatimonadaceae bacterium]
MLGCAPHPQGATLASVGAAQANASDCVVADTSAPTPDTLYVIGVEQRGDTDAKTAGCAAHLSAPPVIVADMPDSGADLRDVLDRGIPSARAPRPDVVITRDATVLAYATSSTAYFTVALPYDRTYLLVALDSGSAIPSQAERDALARDAVTADARGAAAPFPWLTDPSCVASLASPAAAPQSVVAYAAGDPIARQLAERVVALAGMRERPAWLPARLAPIAATPRIAPIAADSMRDALATGRVAAAVIALPRDPRARCGTPGAPLAWRGVPLVDSRAHVIVRRGSGAAFIIGPDGTLRFVRRAAR